MPPRAPQDNATSDARPDFLVTLGLSFPCSPEDVKQAYFAKAKRAHPDAGGRPEEFVALNEAYEKAVEYSKFFASRSKWLAASVDRYVEQQEASAYITSRGGQVEVAQLDWLQREIGDDFAQVLETIVGVRWTGSQTTDADLQYLTERASSFASLRWLDLSNTSISDEGLLRLVELGGLQRLELANTSITHHGLAILDELANLNKLGLQGTGIGAFRLYRIRRAHPGIEITN
jgi:hypothetical protein